MINNSELDSGSKFGSRFVSGTGNFDETMERICGALGVGNDSELARKLGITSASVAGVRKRGKVPPGWILALAYEHGVSADWLLFGTGVAKGESETQAPRSIREPDVITFIPKVNARLSAGNGSLETGDEIKARYAFRTDWINTKGNPSKMVLMDVTGDSMEPIIYENDTVLIDQSKRDILAGKIYAIGMDDVVLIKYVDKEPGKYILRPANKDYLAIPVDFSDESKSVRVIGRVIWWCREAR